METKQVTLKEIPVGGKAKVLKITGSGAVKKHIMDMGVTKGAEVFVRKVAPMSSRFARTRLRTSSSSRSRSGGERRRP